jgi:prolyl oligopeptidase
MPLNTPSLCPVEDVLHGVQVSDPYRWLEDRSLPKTKQWIEVQQEQCKAYFSSCDTLKALRSRVQDYLNVEVVDQPVNAGGRYFYRRRNRDQEQACIYVRETDTGVERLLVDPSDLGPFASVGIHRISDDASLLAYAIKHGGGDTKEIRIVDVASGRILPDVLGSGYVRGFAFACSNEGYYACHEPSPAEQNHLIRFHSFVGSSGDRIVFTRARTRQSRLVLVSDALHLGAIWVHDGEVEPVCDFFIAPRERDGDWRPVFVNKRLPHSPIINEGRIFVLSYEGAPHGKIIELTLDGLDVRTVVQEGDVPPCQIAIAGGRFFVSYIKIGRPEIHSWTLEGVNTGDIQVAEDGTIRMLPRPGPSGTSFFYVYESFTQPPEIYEYSTETEESSRLSQQAQSQEPQPLVIRALSFSGKDGTAIPLTLVKRNGSTHLSRTPVIMTSYGGFGVPMTPQFSVLVTIMMELGAILAIPHIRGGGEFGKAWHDAGRARNRQTAIDDFIAAAEWLCAEGITDPTKLAIFGGSNSGLLVGAAMTQRPGLFRAVLCIAPLLDMVRYERFNQAAKWQQEYGSVENSEDFHALHAYSPYHHIQDNISYPSTLFVSGGRDDRCNPAHVMKMAARLQERTAQDRPILVDYSAERGHSPVLPLSVRVDALARRLAFLCRELGIDVPKEKLHDARIC